VRVKGNIYRKEREGEMRKKTGRELEMVKRGRETGRERVRERGKEKGINRK
jgi:hypothetical protein